MSDPATTRPSFRRRLWRWFGWFVLVDVAAFAVVAFFHQPIILWTLNRFGPDLAARAGVKLQWQVEGSLWSDLHLSAVSADLGEPGMSFKVGKVGLLYDLWPLWHGDYLHIAKGITLHDIDATIDLSHPEPAPSKEAKKSDPRATLELLRKLQLPDLDLRNINATVLLPEATVRVTGLDLQWPAGREGMLRIASIEHPDLAKYPLHDVSARLTLDGTTVRIEELKLPPEIEITHLRADLSKFDQNEVSADTTIRSGQASIDLKVTAHLQTKAIDAVIDIAGLTEADAARWIKDMPPAKAKLDRLHITAKGDPMRPRELDATIDLLLSGLAYDKYRGDRVTLTTTLQRGKLSLTNIAEAAGNRLEASAQADAPAEWKDFARAAIAAQWKLAAPALDKLEGLPVKVSGSIDGSGDANLKNQTLESFSALIKATNLAVDEQRLKSLEANAKGNLEAITFDAKALATAGDGKLDASGLLSTSPNTKSRVSWKLVLPRPDELAKSLKVAWPADLATGEFKTDGDASFDLAQLKAKKFDSAVGGGMLDVKSITWKGAPCDSVHAEWKLEKGNASFPALNITLPGGNQANAFGNIALDGDQAFDGTVMVHLASMPALRPWFEALGQKPITEGMINLQWVGQGALKPALRLTGKTGVMVSRLRLPDQQDVIGLGANFTHDLESATFETVVATFGPWLANFTGMVSKTAVDLSITRFRHNDADLILSGVVQVPLDLQAKPVPVDTAKPMHIDLKTPQLSLDMLAGIAKTKLPEGVEGGASLIVQIDGPLQRPEAKIALTAEGLKAPQSLTQEPGQFALNIYLKDEMLKTTLVADMKPLEPLNASVSAQVQTMPLIEKPEGALDLPFTAEVKLDQRSLDFLMPMVPMFDDLKGSVVIDAKASGTARAPVVKGVVRVDVPQLQPHDPLLPVVKDLSLRLSADGTNVRLDSLHATAAGGVVDVTGTCDLKEPSKPAFNISLKARELLAVRDEAMTLRTDADLVCKGTPAAAELTGSVGLTRGRVFKEINFLPISQMMNDLPPLPDAQASKPAADPGASPLPPMLKDWTFDLAIKTKDDIRLLGNVMNGGARMDLKVTGTGAKPVVVGDVSLEQARLNLPFSTLHIRKGVVALSADRPLDPTLELMAEATVDAYDVVLRGYGRALAPTLRFTSAPPLPEGEIATLLATGATTSGLKKAGDGLAGRALLFAVREAYRRAFSSKSKPLKPGEKENESRFLVQERSEDGQLGGVTGIYEFNRKMKVVGSTNKEGGFRAMFHYLFRFE
jgi:hypothetical protein